MSKYVTVLVHYKHTEPTDLGTYDSLLYAWAATNQVIEQFINTREVSHVEYIVEKENGNV